MKQVHPRLDFASRYSKAAYSTLNAHSAFRRATDLLEDLRCLRELITSPLSGELTNKTSLPWYRYEIISYYSAGFITSLEWHARSRLVDLFTFKPAAVSAADLNRHINDKLLAMAISQGITVAQLLGAIRSISSADSYLAVFQRIFEELSITPGVHDTLMSTHDPSDELNSNKLEQLKSLFDFRNDLIHEIGHWRIGRKSERNVIDLAQALQYGELVLATIGTIERCLTEKAPERFPNKLSPEGTLLDPGDDMEKEIALLEEEVTKAIARYREGMKKGVDDWINALNVARSARSEEVKFAKGAEFLTHNRFAKYDRHFLIKSREHRLEQLHILLEAATFWETMMPTSSEP